MGYDLTRETMTNALTGTIPPWLDRQSHELVQDIVLTLVQHESDLLAVILFGSVARHEERPLDDSAPSDVDLLAIFATDDDPVLLPRGREITHTIGLARQRHLDAPREIQVMFATFDLHEWDFTFIAGVVRDGIVLWSKGTLPTVLQSLEGHLPRPSDEVSTQQQANMI